MFLTCRTVQKGGLLGFAIMTSRESETCTFKEMYGNWILVGIEPMAPSREATGCHYGKA